MKLTTVPLLLAALCITARAQVPARSAEPPVTAVAFAPDGKAVLAGSQAGLRSYSWPDLKPGAALPCELAHVHDIRFSPRGDAVAVVGGTPAEAGSIEVYDWPAAKLRYRQKVHDDLIYAVAWHPEGTRWATAGFDRTAVLGDAVTGNPLRRLTGHSRGLLAVCFTDGGDALITAGIDRSLRVWSTADGRNLRTFDNHTQAVHGLAPRPAADDALPMVASVSDDRTLRLWQPTIGRMVRFARLPARPRAVCWTPEGARLVAACDDGHVRVVDPDSVKVLADLPALDDRAHCLALSPGGDAAAVGGPGGRLRRIELPQP